MLAREVASDNLLEFLEIGLTEDETVVLEPAQKRKIVVEDDRTMRQLWSQKLEEHFEDGETKEARSHAIINVFQASVAEHLNVSLGLVSMVIKKIED